jgi:hypothetical protein
MGGSFANGAQTAAYGFLFNEMLHRDWGGSSEQRLKNSAYKETKYEDGTVCNANGGSECFNNSGALKAGKNIGDYYAVCAGTANGGAVGGCTTGNGQTYAYGGGSIGTGLSAQIIFSPFKTVDNYLNGISYSLQVTPIIGVGISPASGISPFRIPSQNTYVYTFGTPGYSATYGAEIKK